MLTEFEQNVYNTYLAVSRSAQKQPFSLRKDFSDFTESHPNYGLIKKIAHFLEKYPQVDMREFFVAPYEIYQDSEVYYLNFYVTMKAISVYSMYTKKLQETSPDSEAQLNSIKKSLSFIIKYCIDNGVKFSEYLDHKEPGAVMAVFYSHFKEKKTNIYVLMQFPEFEQKMYSLDEELKTMFFDDIPDGYSKYKIKLYKSQKAKNLILNTIKQAKQILH